MKILLIDNYDSFTYNLALLIEEISGEKVTVKRNNQISIDEVENYDKIILSPGPGVPSEAGSLLDIIKKYADHKEILGVCLGQQAIAEAFGGKLINLPDVYHGVATEIKISKYPSVLFKNISERFSVGRYHSWVVDQDHLPQELEITATDEHGHIMALQSKTKKIYGVQFHPESILTPDGKQMLENFIFNS